MYRILVVGGKDGNIPWDRFTDEVEVMHHDAENALRGTVSFTPGRAPDIILVIKKYIGHAAYLKFKKAAKILNIPCVAAHGTFPALVKAARERGHDLSRFLKNGKETQLMTKEVPKAVLSPKLGEWANSFPGNCWKAQVSGATVMVQRTKGGECGLVVKGKVLEFLMGLIQIKKLGSGVRGNLTPEEAKVLSKELDRTFELRKNGIKPPGPGTIIQNVSKLRGTLSPGREKIMREVSAAASAKPPNIEAVLCGVPATKTPEAPKPEPTPSPEDRAWPGGYKPGDRVWVLDFSEWATVLREGAETDRPDFWNKKGMERVHQDEVPCKLDIKNPSSFHCWWVRRDSLSFTAPAPKEAPSVKIPILPVGEDPKAGLLKAFIEKTDEVAVLMAENASLTARLKAAEEKVERLEKQAARLVEMCFPK